MPPVVPPDLIGVWQAFWRLSNARPIGMGAGAIPLCEIDAHIRLFGTPGCDDAREFVELIQQMDRTYLDVIAERRKT